jgi:hypothetical protein
MREYRQSLGDNYFRLDLPKPTPAKVEKLLEEFKAIQERVAHEMPESSRENSPGKK